MSEKIIEQLLKRIELLETQVQMYKKEYQILKNRMESLEDELSKYRTKKTSRNSSQAPSQDNPNTPRKRGLREKTGRKSGGQPGHQGVTLNRTETPDKVVNHSPRFCNCCGADLSSIKGSLAGSYQTVDIPTIKAEFIEHRYYKKTCFCGCSIGESAPHRDVRYGNRIKAFSSYLSARQYIPLKRMEELFGSLFEIPVSEGSISNFIEEMDAKGNVVYHEIHRQLEENGEVIGSDETGMKINGQLYWAWSWQDTKNTYIAIDKSRGKEAVKANFPEGFERAILVHDRWAAQINTPARKHQLCIAHLLRDFQYAIDLGEGKWAESMRKLLKKAIEEEIELGEGKQVREKLLTNISKRLDRLLGKKPEGKESLKLYKSLRKHRDKLLVFIEESAVPSTNNASERSIRNLKVKQKVSMSMRTVKGAEVYCKMRSIIDTLIKRGLNIVDSLIAIASLAAEPG